MSKFDAELIPQLTGPYGKRHIIGMFRIGGPKNSRISRMATVCMWWIELIDPGNVHASFRQFETCKRPHSSEAQNNNIKALHLFQKNTALSKCPAPVLFGCTSSLHPAPARNGPRAFHHALPMIVNAFMHIDAGANMIRNNGQPFANLELAAGMADVEMPVLLRHRLEVNLRMFSNQSEILLLAR